VRGAELRCRRVLQASPGHRHAQSLLGLLLHTSGRFPEAEEVYAALALQEPQGWPDWMNLGTARRNNKRFDAALTAYTRAAELGAGNADFFYNVGLTHIDRSDFQAARAVLKRAAELAPEDAEIRYRYAHACYEAMSPEDATRALEGWQHLSGLTPEVTANIGHLLMNLGEAAQAREALDRAARNPTLDPRAALALAQAFERSNRLSEARGLLDSLAQHPGAAGLGAELLTARAQVAERDSQHEAARELLTLALQTVQDFHLRHFHLFRLAKCLDALGRYEEAFATLLEAHRSQAAHLRLTAPAMALQGAGDMAVTRFSSDPADVASWDHSGAPPLAQSPIFIVAFPRSGTTLLELTLDAHPALASMDEQPFLLDALNDLRAQGVEYPNELGKLSAPQLEQVRGQYWARVRRKVALQPGQRLVDKNPLNILRLPVIRRLFPNARILLAIRHPCDVVVSCFMQSFRSPEFALMCADLGTLANGYRRALDFWYQQQGILGAAAREVRYESFVVDFESQVRGIAEFLELPWDERLLTPGTHAQAKGFISTPSYSQVIQPISSKSVGRWRAYESHLAPIIPVLHPYLNRWGYEG
jgi:Flp pilus assembly protein TadD